MAITNGDILRVAFRFAWDNLDDIVNVWHILVDDVGTALDDGEVMLDIVNAVDTWYAQYEASMPNNVIGQDATGVNITKDELLPVIPFLSAGTSAAEGLPLQTTPLLVFGSATPRHGGRIYLPPTTEANQTDGIANAPLVTVLLDLAADVLAGFTGVTDGVQFQRVSYDRQNAIARPLISAFVPTGLRTQRRRRQGVGS